MTSREQKSTNRSCRFGFVFVWCATMLGCGSGVPQGTLSGTVSFEGKPYGESAIMFVDLKTGQAAGVDIDPDGTFMVTEPMHLGTYKVYLAPRSLPPEENGQPVAVSVDQTVPQKYWDENTTDIQVEIEQGPNEATIDLQK